MQGRSRIFDDLSQLMTNAAGVAQGVKDEAETAFRSRFERLVADMDLVPREEFDAVRDMAQKAREENDRLEARIEALEAKLAEKRVVETPKRGRKLVAKFRAGPYTTSAIRI